MAYSLTYQYGSLPPSLPSLRPSFPLSLPPSLPPSLPQVGDVVFLAGQIGLVPGSMQLFRRENSVSCSIHTEWNRHETQAGQAQLALTHSQSVLLVCHAHLTSALCGVCYVANDQAAIHAKEAWKRVSRIAILS